MKIRFTILLLAFATSATSAQNLGYDGFFHIMDLYYDGQYTILVTKLKNMGFEVVESTPDYELNGVYYKGDFRMEKSRPYPIKVMRDMGITVDTHWKFKTVEYPSYIEIDIDFKIEESLVLFNSIFNNLKDKYGDPNRVFCSNNENCGLFIDKKERYGKDIEKGSLVKFYPSKRLSIRHDDYSDNSISILKGNFTFKIVKYPINTTPEDYFANNDSGEIINIPLKKGNGVLFIPIRIGNKEFSYILDSGASDITIEESTEEYLKGIGVIRTSDYLKDQNYQLADGSIISTKRVKLSLIKIADLSVNDVIASIVKDGSPLLLGQSFLQHFSHWQINNEKQVLELKKY